MEPLAAKTDVVVIGAGAAGLLCAIEAGKRGRSVVVLEHSAQVGRKIAISGGGRCNFTNLHSGPTSFLSANPHFCRSALARYTPADFIALVERHGIPYHEKKLGQLFCDGSAREIIAMLLAECDAAGVEIRTGCTPSSLDGASPFRVETTLGALECASVVVATGGLSIPKTGATDFGYRIARRYGLAIVEPRPGLVPLTLDGEDRTVFGDLAGISFDSVVRCDGAAFRENTLFTHRGLSGPAVLQASSYWYPGEAVTIDLLPDVDLDTLFRSKQASAMELATVLSQHLPKRLAQTWTSRYAPSKPMKQYGKREIEALDARLRSWRLEPAGSEGYGKAEVTCGGVDTAELSSKTMEARRAPGLYFIGEVVDVTGHLGGHNFQWAWASGFAAGQFA